MLALSGCVAAIPLAAGGAILQSQMKGKKAAPQADPSAQDSLSSAYVVLDTGSLPTPVYSASQFPLMADFAAHATAGAQALAEGDTVTSALLVDPGTLRPDRRKCQGALPSVLIDMDPAGEPVPTGDAVGSRELAVTLADLRAQGIAVFWITSRGPSEAGDVRATLLRSGLDPQGGDGLVLMRYPGESKQERRQDLGDTICLLAIAGSERGDFDELYDFLRNDAAAVPLETMFGDGWFVIPQPVSVSTLPPGLPNPVDQSKDTVDALDP